MIVPVRTEKEMEELYGEGGKSEGGAPTDDRTVSIRGVKGRLSHRKAIEKIDEEIGTTWREMEQSRDELETEIEQLRDEVESMQEIVIDQREEIRELRGRNEELAGKVEELEFYVDALAVESDLPITTMCDQCGGELEVKRPLVGDDRVECSDCGAEPEPPGSVDPSEGLG